ncbi:hypothetical protein LX81_02066 [Palleronia aestuarii]|uniref:Imelysin-like domain-containing protein n=1 Tax=Palleronia aestuarii TaxID=568105 RepID=A0A2W7N773_9RHOB|nr:imelysin family protein [Palleronia aestuarii]PZX16215.1 hypothetical protein LX81_02066 [Palleronia aestuarii]
MKRSLFPLLIAFLAGPATAGVEDAIETYILPGYARLSEATETLANDAATDCTAEGLRPAYRDAFDAWARIGHLRIGPVEEQGRVLAIEFWPDVRGMADRTIAGLIADADPAVESEAGFAEVSVAGRGLMALDRLLNDEAYEGYGKESYTCDYVVAVARDLARMAFEIEAEWRDGYAETLASAGDAGNTTYLSEREVRQALFTALSSGLEFDAAQRLGRPLGTFERPRPERAEARRSGLSLALLVASLEGLRDFATALALDTPTETRAAFDRAIAAARDLDDPVFALVDDPQGRFEVEIVQQRIEAARQVAASEIGTALGVSAGFNAGDGD